ncbi:MAG: (Fe-S)-binding protein [Phycisphaeraceae bacterium]
MHAALLITCLTDTFYPRTGIAVVKVLEKLGCTVSFPEAQTCCAQPMWNNGYHDEARQLAKRMIETFADADHVVTPSGSCAAMIREHYPEMFEHEPEWHDRAKAFAARTHEFIEFLLNVLKVDLREHGAKWPGKVTYHYSCHLRGLGVTDEAVRVMQQIEGLEYAPLEKRDQCCGFGGTFAMKYPQISGAMVRDKASCIQATGAATCVSNDAGCTMNIAGTCHRENIDVRFKSLAEIIAEGMGLLEIEREVEFRAEDAESAEGAEVAGR